ncbi:hypothetical protein BH09SUM1_BH09SUM1_21670 [soil metagenome]
MRHFLFALFALLLLPLAACTHSPSAAELFPGYSPSASGKELVETETIPEHVRIQINAPANFNAKRPTELIFFALPNGNTIEQTAGAPEAEGRDWHFYIQHIAAQTRMLRVIHPEKNYVVCYLEAEGLSWPSWRTKRPDNGTQIRGFIERISSTIPGKPKTISLVAHSGGGSMIFGYINGGDAIPADVTRIAWLDADYAYDEKQGHADKLLAWLKDGSHALSVVCYDDSRIMLNGKLVLKTPMGGTFGSTHRMIDRFRQDVPLAEGKFDPFDTYISADSRLSFFIHPNPENKILHTVLVERNGFLHAILFDEPQAPKIWDKSYMDFVE